MSVTTKGRISSPLPFMGQKRNFAKKFQKELAELDGDYLFVDLFGGSGLLSNLAKSSKPNSRVIYNDFDNFILRLRSVDVTNDILLFAQSLIDVKKGSKINEENKRLILERIQYHQSKGRYIDYITLSSLFLFSGKYVQTYTRLEKETWYNKVRKSIFEVSGYLEGVEVVREDYRDLYDRFKDHDKVIFLIDPPYMQTQSIAYKNNWNLQQHLDSLDLLKSERFFYFTSSKSAIIEFFDWLESNDVMSSPFKCCKRVSHQQHVNHASSYEDIMFVKL